MKSNLIDSPQIIYWVLSDIARNILNGNIRITPKTKEKLKRYKKSIRLLGSKTKIDYKKRLINKKGGASFLPLLIKPALTVLAGVLANKLAQK